MDIFMFWLPFYYEAKTVFILFLLLPQFQVRIAQGGRVVSRGDMLYSWTDPLQSGADQLYSEADPAFASVSASASTSACHRALTTSSTTFSTRLSRCTRKTSTRHWRVCTRCELPASTPAPRTRAYRHHRHYRAPQAERTATFVDHPPHPLCPIAMTHRYAPSAVPLRRAPRGDPPLLWLCALFGLMQCRRVVFVPQYRAAVPAFIDVTVLCSAPILPFSLSLSRAAGQASCGQGMDSRTHISHRSRHLLIGHGHCQGGGGGGTDHCEGHQSTHTHTPVPISPSHTHALAIPHAPKFQCTPGLQKHKQLVRSYNLGATIAQRQRTTTTSTTTTQLDDVQE